MSKYINILKNVLLLIREIFLSIFRIIIIAYKLLFNKYKTDNIVIIHPQAFFFGGGEKVLWQIIKSFNNSDNFKYKYITIFCLDCKNMEEALHKLKYNFELDINLMYINFISIPNCLSNNELYTIQIFTKLFELIKCLLIAIYILYKVDNIKYLIDSYNGQFVHIIPKLLLKNKIKTIIYTHYPYTKTKLHKELENKLFESPKIFFRYIYNYIISCLYTASSYFVDLNFNNSTWTHNKLLKEWKYCKNNVIL